MRLLLSLTSVLVLMLTFGGSNHQDHLCTGIVPPEDASLYVRPEGAEGGLDEETFNLVLDKIEEIYNPVFKEEYDSTLIVRRLWDSDVMNASAEQSGSNWYIKMYGGLARHPIVTAGGFLAVACHEIGHHIGGAPKYRYDIQWATSEGQSDYFATMICIKRVLEDWDYEFDYVIDEAVREQCAISYKAQKERESCELAGMMGVELASLLADMRSRSGREVEVAIDTPSEEEVRRTSSVHPHPQCRLDTYFHGALCPSDSRAILDPEKPHQVGCWTAEGQQVSTRRRCWFQPKDFIDDNDAV